MANKEKNYANDSLAEEIDDMLSGYTPSEQASKDDDLDDLDDETETETEEEEDEGSEEEEEDSSEEDEEEADEEESDDDEDSEEADEIAEDEEDDEDELESDEGPVGREALYEELNRLAAGQLDLGEQSKGGDDDSRKGSGEQSEEAYRGQALGADDSQLDIFGEDLDFDDVVTKPEAFNKAMGRLANQTQQITQQNVMRSMVGLVAQQVAQQLSLKSLADKFWEENDDLKPVQKYVGAVATAYQSKYPNKEVGEVFEETARIVREKLGIKKGGGGNPTKKQGQRRRRSSPALVKGGSRRAKTQKSKTTKLQSQIDDIISEL